MKCNHPTPRTHTTWHSALTHIHTFTHRLTHRQTHTCHHAARRESASFSAKLINTPIPLRCLNQHPFTALQVCVFLRGSRVPDSWVEGLFISTGLRRLLSLSRSLSLLISRSLPVCLWCGSKSPASPEQTNTLTHCLCLLCLYWHYSLPDLIILLECTVLYVPPGTCPGVDTSS